MSRESYEHLGNLVVSKLIQIDSEQQRRDVVNKIIDALYAPVAPKIERVDRLVGFLRDMYDGLDEATGKSLTFQIQKICMDVRTKFDNPNCPINTNNKRILANENGMKYFAGEPKWMKKDKKIGKAVRIRVGTHCGMMAYIDEIDQNRVHIKLSDGKVIKYLHDHVEFLE